MLNVTLAGTYPAHTYEKLRALLPETQFALTAVDTLGTVHIRKDMI